MGIEQIKSVLTKLTRKLKQIQPREFLYHKSNPENRKEIAMYGLEPRFEERSEGYQPSNEPAIFATNSNNVKNLFDTTFDDDIWQINPECGVTWYIDPAFDGRKYKHVVTYEGISSDYLKLVHEGDRCRYYR